MSDLATTGFKIEMPPSIEELAAVAEELGLHLGQERIAELGEAGRALWDATKWRESQERHWVFPAEEFNQFGLRIGIALNTVLDNDVDVVIHFAPTQDGKEIRERDLGNGTSSILLALSGLQEYCLLVRAGYIRRPRILFGSTNDAMARASERVGFTRTEYDDYTNVRADYDSVESQVLSEDTQAIIDLLLCRISRHIVD